MKKEWTSGMGQFIAMLSQMHGFVSNTWSSMGIGIEIISWIKTESGKKRAEKILRLMGDEFLRCRACKWQPWKTIGIGAMDYRRALQGTIIRVDEKVNELLNFLPVSSTWEMVDLVMVSGIDLGSDEKATRSQIFERAIEQGLQICPAEVGPQLRLWYEYQPHDERLFVAMLPVADANCELHSFYLKCIEGDLWLFTDKWDEDAACNPERLWVFILP